MSLVNTQPMLRVNLMSCYPNIHCKLFTGSYMYEGMKGLEAHITTMKENVKPVFVKAGRVPYALKGKVEN